MKVIIENKPDNFKEYPYWYDSFMGHLVGQPLKVDMSSKNCYWVIDPLKGGSWEIKKTWAKVLTENNDNSSFTASVDRVVCDCGAVKAKSTHANWCSTKN
jgi:hypothetical protein